MSIGKYTALLKAVELGSISRAAEQLGYTQSAVSRMIADLERDWGMELLHRNRPGIEVTSAGQQLLPILRSITADCAQLQYTVQELHGIQAGLVQVGTFTTVSDKLVPELLTSFHKQYPGISFKLLHSESYSEIEEWLRRGKVDCGFVRIPSANDLDVHFLRRDMLAAVLPLDHPLAHAPFFPVSAFAGESFIKLKIDDEISRFIEQLPLTGSGKVQKFKLREMAIEDLSLHEEANIETA